MSAKRRGNRSPPPDARTIRRLFLILFRHFGKAHPEIFGSSIAIPVDDRLYHVTISLASSHWTTEPFSAHLRIEDLPVRLSAGSGLVDFIALIMPLKPNPKVFEVDVNKVSRAKGVTNIDAFIEEFCKRFKSEWNGA